MQVVLEATPLWERLLTLLIPLVGGALAVIAGILLERRRTTRAQRREHLRGIQDRVLRPLEQRIEKYMLPLLKLGVCNIQLGQRLNPRTSIEATDYLYERRDGLRIAHPDSSTAEIPSRALYECSKRVHHTELIRQYEELEADISDYQYQCLEYVQSLAAEIMRNTGLPDQPPVPWVRAEALALHIYQRQLGLEPYGVKLRSPTTEPTNTLELAGGNGVMIGVTQDQAKRGIQLVTELENSRQHLDELLSKADNLRQRADALRDELERLLYAPSLQGKCEFLSE